MQPLIVIVAIVLLIVIPSLRMCSEWERKVVLRLGRYTGVRGPGVFLLVPWIERTPFTVDLRTVTSSFTAEQTLTQDNVPVNVDTVIFWRVIDPARAVLQVEDYRAAVTAASRSRPVDSGALAITVPCAGLCTSSHWDAVDGTQRPPKYSRWASAVSARPNTIAAAMTAVRRTRSA